MKTGEAKLLLKKQGDNVMLLGILVMAVLIMSLLNPRFFTGRTFESISYQLPEMGLLTIGMMVAMITGGINLSCIASANLSGILMAMLMTRLVPQGEDNLAVVVLAVAAGIAVSMAVGYCNGVIIAYFRVPAILATLATQMLVNGVCLVLTKGTIIAGYPQSFLYLGNGSIGGVPVPLIIFVLCACGMALILSRMPLGMTVYMYGSNATATEFSGVDTKKLLLKTYTLSGFFVGAAAVVLTSRFNSAAAGYAESYLLQAVLIAVLGGVSPNGGIGRTGGTVLAVVILQVVASGLNLLRVSPHLTTALWGIILLAAVAVRARRK